MKIFALIVTFNPDLDSFGKNLAAIAKQVEKVIIVDNSNDSSRQNGLKDYLENKDDVVLIQPKENLGIAYAQNIGFMHAIKNNADYVVTFDQDSSVEDGLIETLYAEYKHVQEHSSIKIACIGPSVINERNNIRYEKYFRNSVKINDSVFSVKSIISSGTLYNVEIFAAIGFNKAEWFIDSIDIEWCYRARYLGYHVLMTTKVAMRHNLGAKDMKLPVGKSINIGSPFRLYFVYRNWIFSLREPQFELGYKLKLLIMMPLKFVIFSNVSPRKSRMLFMLRGIKDGLMKKHSFLK
ncbi:glycosyltransferase family 2 protein [Enterobacter huaxiensis]|uniref:Glycosyltransferase family 2 protein n=1 Tax=Enterobacter huaxiensis TaxID=2494702 RepID=A0ABU6EQC5_9ENTR|nr:glycosyltransferase family 2 protein [Enterobacter huaxiensis]MEB7543268.1 glycosyltransferase family 2 protein [Enterobacter huaxiensis]MEB7579702.1 glycosyltransferase family 2 protein [Enterobacter huaxiensis]MEB7662100.1 glycosyltransferase family 2 protein [Enterobacter huaxiensis]